VLTAPLGAFSALISWPHRPDAATVQIYLDGHPVDRVPASAQGYTFSELWPSTSYSVSVLIRGAAGNQLADYTGSVRTPAQTSPFPRLYSASSFINTVIGPSPTLAANSSAMVNEAITGYANSANFADSTSWGIPIVTAAEQSPSYSVGCLYYWCGVPFNPVHIPADAHPNTGSDGHLVILQPDGGEMDMWVAQHTGSTWTAGTRWLTSATGSGANCTQGQTSCGGADTANLALAAGLVRPEEIAQGHIDHALAITTPDTRQGYVACPATNGDGSHTSINSLPIGAHIQLNPNINVASLNLPTWEKVIATALQQYGAYVTDTGGSLAVEAESNLGRTYDAWANAGVPSTAPSLANLPWSSMHVLSMTRCG
jgi:hypothetical protein